MDWGDYDNDGDLDYLSGKWGARAILYRNDNGSFSDVQALPDVGNYTSATFADYNNDGFLDILLGVYDGINKLYLNDGKGNFSQKWSSIESSPTITVAWGDYDNDGDLDFVISNYSGPAATLYRNNGSNNFTKVWDAEVSDIQSWNVNFGDYNNDGDLDFILGGNDNSVRLYYNAEAQYNNINSTPTPPGNIKPNYLPYPDRKFTVTWEPGYDTQTSSSGLYYTVRIATISNLLNPSSYYTSGVYGTPLFGAYLRPRTTDNMNKILFDRPQEETTYYVQIAGIDTGLRRSSWSVEKIYFIPDTVPPGKVTGVEGWQSTQSNAVK
ncbi:MAG: hypothetical protein COS17_07515, partial [Elusimicrobia bacterium CG02_land_8_20_14_3_00_37_13]